MSVATFIPEIWSARLIHALDNAHVATNFVNRDYEGEIKRAGDTVHINTIGAITVGTYTSGTPLVRQTLTTTDQTLVIDQQKYFDFEVDDVDRVQAAGDLIDVAMGRSAYALADVADGFLFGKMVSGVNASNVLGADATPITLTSANIYDNIIDLRTMLDLANVPTMGRKLAVNPETYALLLKDTSHFAPVTDTGAGGVFVNGFVGRVGGFDVFMSNNLVTSATSFALVASVPEATTYAEQILETEAFRPDDAFADAVKGLHVYGAKVVNDTALAVLYGDI